MQTENLVRRDTTLVNEDLAAYAAAKLRKKRVKWEKSLEERINTLESAVAHLEATIEEMKSR